MQAGVIRAGDVVSTSDASWAALHGIVTLADRMPMFDAQRAHAAADVALEMIMSGLQSNKAM